jgi:hypothetical protein
MNGDQTSPSGLAPSDATTTNADSDFRRMISVLIVESAAILLLAALLPLSTDLAPSTIYILHPAVSKFLALAAFGSGALLIIAAICCACHRWWGRMCIALALAILGVPFALVTSVVRNLGPWEPSGSAVAADHQVYRWLDSGLLQGQTLAIGRDEGDGWLYHRYELVGETNGDYPRLWIPLVRPAGVEDSEYRQVYCSDSGVVVGVRYENHCFMAYDTNSGSFFGNPVGGQTWEKITAISPFILIGPETQLHEPDVARILRAPIGERSHSECAVSVSALQQALNHPNAKVRELAQRLLALSDEDHGKNAE